jgi:transcriptional coactivator HFI1/ADA1
MDRLQGCGECLRSRYATVLDSHGLLVLTQCEGQLNQAEMSWVLQPLLNPVPSTVAPVQSSSPPQSTLHLHNILITCLYANIQRDSPSSEVAPWVVATDKPATASKTAGAVGANDKAEERLKREVMSMHARDRRRIKALKPDPDARVEGGLQDMLDYQRELEVKQPEAAPATAGAGGLAKTNWDLEIHRKYAQPLAAETLEFPSFADIQSKIEPACYEEGLSGGVSGSLRTHIELVEQAAEVWTKELLGRLVSHSRSNGEGCIQTSKFMRQLRIEEQSTERSTLQRNAAGLVPVGVLDPAGMPERKPLDAYDLRLTVQLQDRHFKQEPFLAESIMLSQYPDLSQPARLAGDVIKPLTNGVANHDFGDPMIVDEDDWGWQGGSVADQEALMGVLDDCLDFTA